MSARQPSKRTPRSTLLTSIRLPLPLLARADALVRGLGGDPTYTAVGTLTRAAILRLAIVKGLAALEKRSSKRGER